MDGDDARRPAGHRLHGRHPERLVPRRQGEHGRGPVVGGHLLLAHVPEPIDVLGDTEVRSERLPGRDTLSIGIGVGAYRQFETGIGHQLAKLWQRLDQQVVPLVCRRSAHGVDVVLGEPEPLPDRIDLGRRNGRVPALVDARRDHHHVVRRDVVVLGQHLDLLVCGGDDQITTPVREEFLADPLLESIVRLDLLGVAGHVGPLPRTERVGGVDMGDAELLRDPLARVAGVPVVRVDGVISELSLLDLPQERTGELVEVVVHVLFADEVRSPERNTPHPETGSHVVELRLVLESPRHDVDVVAEVTELLRQFEHEHDLTTRVGEAEFGLRGHIAVEGQHEQPGGSEMRTGHVASPLSSFGRRGVRCEDPDRGRRRFGLRTFSCGPRFTLPGGSRRATCAPAIGEQPVPHGDTHRGRSRIAVSSRPTNAIQGDE